MHDDDFLPRLGRSRSDRSFLSEIRRATNLARGGARVGPPTRRFTGERIGRGASMGRVLGSSDRFAHARARRVIVKARIVRLGGKGASGAVAHLRYLQRDGTTREGDRGSLYDAGQDTADGKEFLARGKGDRHQFRFIVSAEDGAEYTDLKPVVRRLMADVAKDLGTKLDWVAVDHFNTGHPHSHILVRGTDDRGKNLIIAKEYIAHGFRTRACEIVNRDLGPRTDMEILQAQQREVTQERFTSIDRRLLEAATPDRLVAPVHPDGIEQAARAGRLQTLGRMGLAVQERGGLWRLDDKLEPTLKAMARRGDIIATMHHELGKRDLSQNAADYAIYNPTDEAARPIIGRVVIAGLLDEHADRRYLIVEGVDGLSHHVDVGELEDLPPAPSIVRISPAEVSIRAVDRTVADIAAANGGRYSVDIHLRHDPTATQSFAETHVRRLEAIRRAGGGVAREADGSWTIAQDHLARVGAYEREKSDRLPVVIETLSSRGLDDLPRHNGATWLDRDLVSSDPIKTERGFGAEVRRALQLRQQWLIEQGLAEPASDNVRYAPGMVETLLRRDVARVGAQLSKELGLAFVPTDNGAHVEGKLARAVQVGDSKFAIVERAHEFSLVPWKPVLERQFGKQVSGIMRGTGEISWTIGRGRGLEI